MQYFVMNLFYLENAMILNEINKVSLYNFRLHFAIILSHAEICFTNSHLAKTGNS